MPDFLHTAVKEIDDQLRTLKDEASRLEAARAALTGTTRRRGRAASNRTARTPARRAGRRNGRPASPRSRGGNTRATQALDLVRETPGITIPEIAKAMKIEPNYLYRVLPRLASDGQVKRDGQGWHPARHQSPRVPKPSATPLHASKHAPPSASRRHLQLGPHGLAEPTSRRHRRPMAAGPTAPPKRPCSLRLPVATR